MGKKLTFSEVKDRLSKINPYIEILSDESEYKNTNTRVICRCKIDGYEWNVTVTSLLHQKSGCPKCAGVAKYTIEEKNEILNNKGNKIRIINQYYMKKTKRTICVCICKICGQAFEADWSNLNAGKSCPKCARKLITKEERQKIILEKGINATILEVYSKYRGKKTVQKETYCKCQCNVDGHIWEGSWTNLSSGRGCPKCANANIRYTLKDIQGFVDKHNMDIKILSKEIRRINGRSKSFVKCKCRKDSYIWWTQFNNLTQLKGCPVCSGSNLEKITQEALQDKHIDFIKEYRFEECRNDLPLPFDFYLPSYNIVIELDGEQHFKPVRFGGISHKEAIEQFKIRKLHDKIKNQFCKNNNIRLVRIPYYNIKEIPNIIDKMLQDNY